jgi:hypothetical protein
VKHGNAKGSCTKCHPTVLSTYVCTNCHDPEKMKKKHDEKGISDLSNCIACHPSGKEE